MIMSQHNTQCRFDLCIYGIPKVYVLETNLTKFDEMIDGFRASMKDVLATVEDQDGSVFLMETNLRGVARFIGKNARKAFERHGVEAGPLEIYVAPESYIYKEDATQNVN